MTQQNNEFEKWWKKEVNTIEFDLWKNQYPDNTWQYADHSTNLAWITWQAAKATSEREIAELKAHINVLREALEIARDYQFDAVNQFHNDFAGYKEENHKQYDADLANTEKALASTPAQSLQAHDDEVIERCANVCENMDSDGYSTIEQLDCAKSIRALKGQP